jgi:hypothetical protein
MDLILGTLLKSLEIIQCLRVEWAKSVQVFSFYLLVYDYKKIRYNKV